MYKVDVSGLGIEFQSFRNQVKFFCESNVNFKNSSIPERELTSSKSYSTCTIARRYTTLGR
jgi:hypothetical protein